MICPSRFRPVYSDTRAPISKPFIHPRYVIRACLPLSPHARPANKCSLMSARILSQIGSFALFYPPLLIRSLSSLCFRRHDDLVVVITAESKNVVGRVSWANLIRIPAVNAVAPLPRWPASCLLSTISPINEDFSASPNSRRKGLS